MMPSILLQKLEAMGIELTAELDYSALEELDDATKQLLVKYKQPLLCHLLEVPPVPWELRALLRAALIGALEFQVPGVPDTNQHVRNLGIVYLLGDRDEPLKQLMKVYHQWQGTN